jgi:hypothetical protein
MNTLRTWGFRTLAVVALGGALLASAATDTAAQTPTKAPSAARSSIELDGVNAGWLFKSAERGGADGGNVTVLCGTGMSRGFYEWIKASFDAQYTRKNGAIVSAADVSYKATTRLEFRDALVTEVGFPACDAASKDMGTLRVTMRSSMMRVTSAPQATTPAAASAPPADAGWPASHFRLKIDGLDDVTAHVERIEPFVVRWTHPGGPVAAVQVEPISIEVPDLVIHFNSSKADAARWQNAFVIDGNNDESKEKSGTLEYLAANGRDVLFKLDLRGIRAVKLTPEDVAGQNIRRVKTDLHVGGMKFSYGAGAVR